MKYPVVNIGLGQSYYIPPTWGPLFPTRPPITVREPGPVVTGFYPYGAGEPVTPPQPPIIVREPPPVTSGFYPYGTGGGEIPPEPPSTPQSSCDPLRGQFFDPRTGRCRGSVSSLPSFGLGPMETTAPGMTAMIAPVDYSAFMGARLRTVPLMQGRF